MQILKFWLIILDLFNQLALRQIINQNQIGTCMTSLHQTRQKSDDLSTYIKKQLSTLLKQVQQTPPKKSTSLKKIQHIVEKSNIPKQQKLSIQKKIKRVQSAMIRSQTVDRIKLKLKNEPKTPNKYEKKLFYENMILEQKQLNLKNKLQAGHQKAPSPNKVKSKQFLNLVETFEDLRTKRLMYENEIQSLAIKAQKMERLIELKKQNEEKYLQSTIISRKYHQKKEQLQIIKNEVKNAAKQNRRKVVSVLMKKYSQVQEST